jgi:hypothetical protein
MEIQTKTKMEILATNLATVTTNINGAPVTFDAIALNETQRKFPRKFPRGGSRAW